MNVHNPAKDIYVGVMKTCKRVFGSSIKLCFKLTILKWGVDEFQHNIFNLIQYSISLIYVNQTKIWKILRLYSVLLRLETPFSNDNIYFHNFDYLTSETFFEQNL